MKQTLNKLKDGALIGIGILLVFGIVNAIDYSATSGETLTAQKWNDLVTKVSGVFTDGSGNVGVGTETPSKKLVIAGGDLQIEQSNGKRLVEIENLGGYGSINLHDTSGANTIVKLSGTGTYFYTGNVGIGTKTPTSTLDVNGKIRGNATYSFDSSSVTTVYTNLGTTSFSDIETSIVVQTGDVVKVDLACNLKNDNSGGTSYMRVGIHSGSSTTKIIGNRISSNGGTANIWVGGSSIGVFKATADGTLTFRAEGHVSSGTGRAVYCNIIAYVIGKE